MTASRLRAMACEQSTSDQSTSCGIATSLLSLRREYQSGSRLAIEQRHFAYAFASGQHGLFGGRVRVAADRRAARLRGSM
jgi:hypothetical protein